jgi:hypothetical protein
MGATVNSPTAQRTGLFPVLCVVLGRVRCKNWCARNQRTHGLRGKEYPVSAQRFAVVGKTKNSCTIRGSRLSTLDRGSRIQLSRRADSDAQAGHWRGEQQMTRNLKTLALTLATVLSAGAIIASTAQAEKPAQLTAEAGTVKVDGRQITPITLVRLARKIKCEVFEFNGPASNGASTIENVTPIFAKCEDEVLVKPVTVSMNGCTFTFHFTADMQFPEDTWTLTSDLVCPSGPLKIVIYNNPGHTEVLCAYTGAAQAGKKTIDLTNANADVKVNGITTSKNFLVGHVNVGAIKLTKTEGSVLVCGAEANETATLTGEVHLWGTDSNGAVTGITVSTK